MRVMIRSYIRRDRTPMIYLNDSGSISVAIGPDREFQVDRLEGKKRALYQAILKVFERAPEFCGDIQAAKDQVGEHRSVLCGPFLLVISDDGFVGGVDQGEAGAWVIHTGYSRIIKANRWYELAG